MTDITPEKLDQWLTVKVEEKVGELMGGVLGEVERTVNVLQGRIAEIERQVDEMGHGFGENDLVLARELGEVKEREGEIIKLLYDVAKIGREGREGREGKGEEGEVLQK